MARDTLGVSVVICTYSQDRWPDLEKAVASVRNQSAPPCETIVVVDHNPTLLDRVRRYLPEATAIENVEHQGLSGARNTGVSSARGDLIAFLDDDATADSEWLSEFTKFFEDKSVMGVGGRVEPNWLSTRPGWFPPEFYWVIGCSYEGLPRSVAPVRNLFGGCMCIRRSVFESVGGFLAAIGRSGTVPMGCEETELCIRAGQRWPDRVFLYEPKAVLFHSVPESRTSWSYFRSRCYAEGLSKAMVSRCVGVSDSLSSERSYVSAVLPRAVVRNLTDTFSKGDFVALRRAVAVVAGLTITTAGYVVGTLRGSWSARSDTQTGVIPVAQARGPE